MASPRNKYDGSCPQLLPQPLPDTVETQGRLLQCRPPTPVQVYGSTADQSFIKTLDQELMYLVKLQQSRCSRYGRSVAEEYPISRTPAAVREDFRAASEAVLIAMDVLDCPVISNLEELTRLGKKIIASRKRARQSRNRPASPPPPAPDASSSSNNNPGLPGRISPLMLSTHCDECAEERADRSDNCCRQMGQTCDV
ncbi:hypothetical protein G7046_g2911 [Stylonectria norvegica]|nr:hypothetical protein G7046_g2911 [Stylonectria norvegica]